MKLTFRQLRKANAKRGRQWDKTPNDAPTSLSADLSFRAMELGGEAGEALNVAKKIVRGMKCVPGGIDPLEGRRALQEELADVIICVDRVAELMAIDLEEAVIEKFNKTSRKYGFIELPE